MNSVSIRRNGMPAAVAITLTVLIGCVNLIDVRLSLVLVVGLIVGFVLYLKPPYALAALIFLAPFARTALLSGNFAGIPGLKIINLVLLAVVAVFVLSQRRFRLSAPEGAFILGAIVLLTISVLRSVPHLHILNYYFDEAMGTGKYLVSYLFKPIFFFSPFLIISGYMRERDDIDFVVRCFRYAMLVFSIAVLCFYGVGIADKSSFAIARSQFGDFFGMHTNDMADFYILGYPIVLAWFLLQRDLLNTANLLLALASVALLYSRTAYVLVVVSTVLFLVLDKRKKLLPAVIFLGVLATFVAPETVIERGLTGIEERNMQAFSAGRVDNIWLPLLNDVKGDPEKILAGSGRYAIIHSSPLWKGHAHNMYLTTFLDTGFIGLSFFLAFFAFFLVTIRKGFRQIPEGKDRTFLAGALVSIAAYLMSGMTGRNFFPEMSNSYLWITLAIALNIIKIHAAPQGLRSAADRPVPRAAMVNTFAGRS